MGIIISSVEWRRLPRTGAIVRAVAPARGDSAVSLSGSAAEAHKAGRGLGLVAGLATDDRSFRQGTGRVMVDFNYVIVGAGTACCGLARRLPARPGDRVVAPHGVRGRLDRHTAR